MKKFMLSIITSYAVIIHPSIGHARCVQNEAVTDARTGYIWKRCAEGMTWTGETCGGEPLLLTVADANSHIANERHRTKINWRLPSIGELITIVDYDKASPAIDLNIFPNTPSKIFLTSSRSKEQMVAYWGIFFMNGAVIPYERADFDNKPMRFVVRLICDK